jgi:hypothetical protein
VVLDADLRQPAKDARVSSPEGSADVNAVRAPVTVVFARLRAQPGRAALAAAGVTAATALLVVVFTVTVTAEDKAVQQAVKELPAAEQTFRLDLFSASASDTRADDRVARRVLRSLAPTPIRRTILFRVLRINGALVRVAAVDGLDRVLRLRSGRLPHTCTARRCEVVQVGAGGRPSYDEGGIALTRVGVGEFPDDSLFGPLESFGEGGPAPLLLAPNVASLERLSSLASFYRVESWVQRLDPQRLHEWAIPRLLTKESNAQASLELTDPTFRLTGPDDALLTARTRGRIAAQRLALVGGEVSALLLGFALVAAMGLRRGQASERRRLLQRGARTPQIWLATIAEVAVITGVGWLAGVGAGITASALVARAAGVPAGATLAHALGTPLAITAIVAAWVVSTVTVVLVSAFGDGATRRARILDVIAVAAAVVVVVAASRGAARPETINSSGDRALLLLLPGLACLVAAVAVARLLSPLMRGLERASRGGPVTLRLAALALARAPARTGVTAAFVVVTVGLALFAASYRATLDTGAQDAAVFEVPLDYRIQPGRSLASPTGPQTREFARVAQVYPVIRDSADVPGSGAAITSATVVGLPANTLAHLHWRSDFASESPAKLEAALGLFGHAQLRGASVPRNARDLRLHARAGGVPVRVTLVAEDADGTISRLPLGVAMGDTELRTRVPAGAGPTRVVALEVAPTEAEATALEHNDAEGGLTSGAAGTLAVGPLLAANASGNRVLTRWHEWLGHAATGSATGLRYTFTGGESVLLRPRQPTDDHAVPVVVSPGLAHAAGRERLLSLDFQDVHVRARVVAVAKRFPTIHRDDGEFAIADLSQLRTALDADAPGTGAPDELWLAAPADAAGRIAFRASGLEVESRRALAQQLEDDPLARATELTLAAAAIVALLLAALGFWVAATSELRDERGELFDLEAQGVEPAKLRDQLRVRGGILLVLGATFGAALGLLLSSFVASLVRISSTSELPEPPLRVEHVWALAAGAIVVLLLLAALAAELAARRAFRTDTPLRSAWSSE